MYQFRTLVLATYLGCVVHDQYGGHDSAQSHVVAQYVAIVRDAILVDAIRYKEQDERGEGAMQNAVDELAYVEEFTLQTRRIKTRILQAMLIRNVLLKDAQCQHRQ